MILISIRSLKYPRARRRRRNVAHREHRATRVRTAPNRTWSTSISINRLGMRIHRHHPHVSIITRVENRSSRRRRERNDKRLSLLHLARSTSEKRLNKSNNKNSKHSPSIRRLARVSALPVGCRLFTPRSHRSATTTTTTPCREQCRSSVDGECQ